MARTVIPPDPDADGEGDKLPDKLIKYVPAEALAFFVPAAALLGDDNDSLLVGAIVVAILGSIGWLWYRAQDLPAAKRPLWSFYALSGIAFLAWAVSTSASVAKLVDLDEKATSFILLAAVFLIPLADGIATRLLRGSR